MRQLTFFVFLLFVCRPSFSSAGCIDVLVESESASFASHLAAQLQNEPDIQLKKDSAMADGSCATIVVKMVDDVAIISPQQSELKPVLIDLSTIDPEHWARTVALACATLNVAQALPENDRDGVGGRPDNEAVTGRTGLIGDVPGKVAPSAPKSADDAAGSKKGKKNKKGESNSDAVDSRAGSVSNAPLLKHWGIEFAGGLRWIASYEKDGAGPIMMASIRRRFNRAVPEISLVFSRHTAATRLAENGVQLHAGGIDAAVWRIFFVSTQLNLWLGAGVELLIASARGHDNSYAVSNSGTVAVVSALGRLKGEYVVTPRMRLCANFSMGWTMRAIEIRVTGNPVLGMEKLLFDATLGIILSW